MAIARRVTTFIFSRMCSRRVQHRPGSGWALRSAATVAGVDAILDDFAARWGLYVSMPFIAAVIGYVTKLVAIRMMFHPIYFVGIEPFLGWQGVVPRNSERMIRMSADLLTTKLVDPQELFARLDPDR